MGAVGRPVGRRVRLAVVHVVLVGLLLVSTPLVQPASAGETFFNTGREVCEGDFAGRHTHPFGAGLNPGTGYEVSAITVPAGATLTVALTGRKVAGSGVIGALTNAQVRSAGGTTYGVVSATEFVETYWSTVNGSWTNNTGSNLVGTFELGLSYAYLDYRMAVSIGGLPTASCRVSALLASEFFGPSGSLDNGCPCRTGTRGSIDTWTGNEHFPLPGLDAGGRGPGLDFELAYNSGDADAAGIAGYGWSSSYDMSMTVEADGSRLIHQETGATVPFYPDGGGGWGAPVRHTAALSESGGVWTFTRQNFQTFEFDSAGRLSKIKDRNGYSATIVRDGSFRVSYVEHSDGRRLTFTYATNQVTITDPLTPTPRTVVIGFDGSGDLTSYKDIGGGTYAMTYLDHKLVTVRKPRHANDAIPQPMIELHYDTHGRADWEEDELDRRTTLYYDDPAGSTTRRVMDGDAELDVYVDGRLTKKTSAYGTSDVYSVAYTYDVPTLGVLTKTVDPGGLNLTWAYEYDSRGNRTKTTDPENHVTRATYNGDDQLATLTDANNVVTTNSYDANGNLELTQTASTTDPVGTRTVDPGYDPAHPGDMTTLTDDRGKVWRYGYDSYGFVNKTATPVPDSDTITMVNNTVGWVTSTVAPKGNPLIGGVPANYTTTFTYNGYGEVKNTSGPAGVVQRNYYLGGLLKEVIDQSTQTTTYAYSDADELTTETRPGSSVLSTEYNVDGTMKAQVDAASARTEYTYDRADRLLTVKDPLLRVTTFGYDAGSRLVSKQQPGGNCATLTDCIKYEYFNDGQLKKVDYSDTTPDVTYTYEPTGRPATMNDGAASPATWDWDDLGRLKSYTDITGATSYGYDGLSGLVNQITYPDDKVVNRTFDNAGRMNQVTDWASRATAFDFDPNGNLDLTTFPSATGNSDDYTYDAADRMTAVSFNKTGSPALGQLTFTRTHPEGFVSASSGSGVPNAAETYGYSTLDQLDNLSGSALTYDPADNLTGFASGPTQRFDAASQLCYQASTSTAACGAEPADATVYGYDNRGNRITSRAPGQAAHTSTYDQADRLVSAPSNPAGSTQGDFTVFSESVLALDTPSSTGDCTPGGCGVFAAGETKNVKVTGISGIPTSVEAVLLNVTTVGDTSAGWVKINPAVDGSAAGLVHIDPVQLNDVVVIARPDPNGRISVFADQSVGVMISVAGVYATSAGTPDSTFTAVTPDRIVDTRPATQTGTCSGGCTAMYPGGQATKTMKVTGVGNVPATGVSAVYVSVLAANPSYQGKLEVNSDGYFADARIDIDGSSSNAGTAIADVDANGNITVTVTTATDVVIDIGGWFGATGEAGYVPVEPARVFNTTPGAQTGQCNPTSDPDPDNNPCVSMTAVPGAPVTQFVKVADVAGFPAADEMTAVVLAVTATSSNTGSVRVNWNTTDGSADAILNLYGSTGNPAVDSSLVIAIPNADGKIRLTAFATGTTGTFDVYADAIGYFTVPQTTYSYAGDGLRRTKTSPDGTITTYTWDHSGNLPLLLAEVIDVPGGTANDKTIRYIYGPDGHVIEDIIAGFPRYYHHDQLGSTRLLSGSAGNTLGTAGYTPHGKTATTIGATTPIGWAGEYLDNETGYIYLRARYYDPSTGQFLNRDPAVAETREPYAYAGNDPVNFTDPTGHNKCEVGLNPLRWGGNAQECADSAWDATGGKVATGAKHHGTVTFSIGCVIYCFPSVTYQDGHWYKTSGGWGLQTPGIGVGFNTSRPSEQDPCSFQYGGGWGLANGTFNIGTTTSGGSFLGFNYTLTPMGGFMFGEVETKPGRY